MQYLIRTDEPFRGHCESVLNKDGTVGYTDGLTIEQYRILHEKGVMKHKITAHFVRVKP